MDRFVRAGMMFRRDWRLGYGLALASFALALFSRFHLQGTLPPGFPYLTFFPAVIVTTFLAGLWPGILCAALCGVAALYFFIPPVNSFAMDARARSRSASMCSSSRSTLH